MSLSQTSTALVGTIDTYELRLELKAWEHDFLAANGRKPAKGDIKANQEMATKYKLYDKLARRLTSTRPSSSATSDTTPLKKRKRDVYRDSGIGLFEDAVPGQFNPPTPRKVSLKADGTVHPADIDPYDPPLNAFFSPLTQRTFVAPTPQKNGRILGLFDLLSPESARKTTPSKRKQSLATGTPSEQAGDVSKTPSKSRISKLDLSATPSRRARTSADNHDVLTPSKNRVNGALNTPSIQRTKKLDLEDTPECLRRYPARGATPPPAESVTEHGDADGLMNITWSPIAARQPRKKFGRSFSELAKDIRKREEKKFDDELDVLRDLEEEETTGPKPTKRIRGSDDDQSSQPQVALEQDLPIQSAVSGDLPLGPDGDHEADRSDADVANETKDSQTGPRRWKKKGPKRQTKKFNIRPTHNVKWKPEPEWKGGIDEEIDEEKHAASNEEDENDVVLETQVVSKPRLTETTDAGYAFESEEELSSDDNAPKTKTTRRPVKKGEKQADQDKRSKPTKTIKATANANFRSLKIKNKNSKAKGRFGRRRG